MNDVCESGVYDISGFGAAEICPSNPCAPYRNDFTDPKGRIWIPVVAALFGLIPMAFSIGANDAANSWATSIGSRAIAIKPACIVAGIMNFLGAVTLGYGVSSKITKGVSSAGDSECWACGYCDSLMSVYNLGMFGSLIGGTLFLLLATQYKLPVSTTHSAVGGIIGVTVAGVGAQCLNFGFPGGLGGIFASWAISPVLSGVIGVIMFVATKHLVFKSPEPRKAAFIALPILMGLTTFVMIFLILVKAGPTKKNPKWIMALVAFGIALVVAFASQWKLKSHIMRNLPSETQAELSDRTTSYREAVEPPLKSKITRPEGICAWFTYYCGKEAQARAHEKHLALQASEAETMDEATSDALFVFRYLLVYIAAWESFAHGANDTANATAAYAQILNGYENGIYACSKFYTPVYIMAIAGLFVALGIWTLGYRVIQRIGSELTSISFHTGFCIEFGSTMSIIIATVLDMPVSTTHCQIGAVFFVGLASYGCKLTQWSLLGQILLSWIFTIPCAAAVSSMVTAAAGYWLLDYRNNQP